MKPLKFFLITALMGLLVACGPSDETAENFEGRWSLQKGRSIFKITKIDDDSVMVHATYDDALYQIRTRTIKGSVKDNVMTLSGDFGINHYTYDPETNRFTDKHGTYRPVPDDWEWRDGYDILEGFEGPTEK